jgi:pimeloyl-ACP methyl ester carboxylesterase
MAEPHCERWRDLSRSRAYVVCPRGTPIGLQEPGRAPTGYFYRDHRALGREVMAARAAAIDAFSARLDPARALYAGFSQGATMGALFLHELADTPDHGAFAKLVLVDGGWVEWTKGLAEKEKASGLERVVLVCGQTRCAREGKKRVGWMEQAGLAVRYAYAQGAGHTWGGAVGDHVEASLPWLLEGDDRFVPDIRAND